jgi:uncharacterized protein (TIGR03067 family)
LTVVSISLSLKDTNHSDIRTTKMPMNKIHKLLIITLAGFTISLVRAADDEAVKKDFAQLQGEWTMVSASADGQSMSEDMLKQMKRVCKGDEITVTMGDQVFLKAKITIDPSKKPKTIDYDMTEGFSKGKKQLGIYELKGDTFKACFNSAGAERPTEFKAGEGLTLSEWKRQKSTAAAESDKK